MPNRNFIQAQNLLKESKREKHEQSKLSTRLPSSQQSYNVRKPTPKKSQHRRILDITEQLLKQQQFETIS